MRRSIASQSAGSEGIRPPNCARAPMIVFTAPSPSPLIAVSPNRTPFPGSTVKLNALSLMLGGSIGMPRSFASLRYTASLSVFCASIVRSAAAKCHG